MRTLCYVLGSSAQRLAGLCGTCSRHTQLGLVLLNPMSSHSTQRVVQWVRFGVLSLTRLLAWVIKYAKSRFSTRNHLLLLNRVYLYVFVRACVSPCVCIRVCMCVCMKEILCVYLCDVCACTCIRVPMVRVCRGPHRFERYTYKYIDLSIVVCIHIYMYKCMYIRIHICMYIYICLSVKKITSQNLWPRINSN